MPIPSATLWYCFSLKKERPAPEIRYGPLRGKPVREGYFASIIVLDSEKFPEIRRYTYMPLGRVEASNVTL